jgi:hypothetical protein
MTEVCFTFGLFEEILFPEEFEDSIHCDINDVKFAKEVFLVLLIDLPLADEHMIEGLLNKHMKDVIVFMLEEQIYQAAEKPRLTDLLKDLHA